VVASWFTCGLFEGLALISIVPLLSGESGLGSSDRPARLELFGGVLEGRDLRTVALASFVGFGLLSAGARFVAERQGVRLTANIEESMRRRSTSLLLRMRWSSFLEMRLGDINTSMLAAGTQVGLGAQWFLRGVGALVIAMLFCGIALVINTKLSLLTFAFATLAAVGYRYTGKRAEAHAKDLAQHANTIGGEVAQIFGNLKYFRSTGNVTRSEERASAVYRQSGDAYFRSQIYGPIMRVAFEAGALVFVGAILTMSLVLDGRFTAESVAFFALFYRLAPRILTAQEFFQLARTQRPWYESSSRQAAAALAAQESRGPGRPPSFEHRIEARGVSFTFPGTDRAVVEDVSWGFEKGRCLAFVGESGSGKTTMLDLVTGLLAPTSGDMLIDGVPLTEIDIERWQSSIGLVMQETPLFHATVIDNITWTEPVIDRERVRHCLQLAHALEFVDALPQGVDTVVGESGGRLSGGERQRLALARALYRDPSLLILDEATSALDPESEALVQTALEGLKGSCSMLIVAHRLTTVRLADRILVLDEGRVVEEGTWNELLSRQGCFSAMALRQQLNLEMQELGS
jgi:ABC-type multidrug transport system fused ATPase/permease subunit